MRNIPVILMPQVTIEALIKKLNKNYNLSRPEMDELLTEYRRLNGTQVFSPGAQVKIPVKD